MKRTILFLLLCGAALAQDFEPLDYNADVKKTGSQKEYRFHVKHVNFKNASGKFRPVKRELSWKSAEWAADSLSYPCTIPQYSDGWISFTNNYNNSGLVILARPVANHVAGIAHTGEGGNFVYYKNAWGDSLDFMIELGRNGLKKTIIIKTKPAQITDMAFDFELSFPQGIAALDIKNAQGVTWNKTGELVFTDDTVLLGQPGKEIYFKRALMWDASGKTEPVPIKIYKSGKSIFLRKTIPAAFLSAAVYPVYTDHPTDYYAGSGSDGQVYYTNSTWSTCRAAATGSGVSQTRTDREWVRNEYASPDFEITRLFFPFDTAALGDGDTVTAALLKLYCGYKIAEDNDGNDFSVVIQTSQADATSLATADFDAVGTTEGSDRIDTDGLTASTWATYTLDADGIGWVSKTGYTLLGLRMGHDLLNHAIDNASDKRNSHEFAISESANDPYLSVTASAAGGQVIIFNE